MFLVCSAVHYAPKAKKCLQDEVADTLVDVEPRIRFRRDWGRMWRNTIFKDQFAIDNFQGTLIKKHQGSTAYFHLNLKAPIWKAFLIENPAYLNQFSIELALSPYKDRIHSYQ